MSNDTQNQEEDVLSFEDGPFQIMDGDWEFNPFLVKLLFKYKKKPMQLWVQARNRDDFMAMQSNNPELYGREIFVAIRDSAIHPSLYGAVVKATHQGMTGATALDIGWLRGSLFAAKHPALDKTFPEIPLDSKTCNDIGGVLRANDGRHPDREFSNQYFD